MLSSADRRQQALAVLAAFPSPRLGSSLVSGSIALGTSKFDRPLAQQMPGEAAGVRRTPAQGPLSRQVQERTAAVEWIARLGPEGAMEALQAGVPDRTIGPGQDRAGRGPAGTRRRSDPE